jgi:hypothetical protein
MTAQSTVVPEYSYTGLPITHRRIALPAPKESPVTVTIQVTLPGGQDTMTMAAQLAEQLHALTAVATIDAQPAADVSTTVAVVVNRTGPSQRGSSHLFARPATSDGPAMPLRGEALRDVPNARLYTDAPLKIDNSRRDVVLCGVPVLLTRREYDLLLFLAGHPGRVFTRPQLLKWVWGYEIVSGERTVDVHIRRVRRKLREHGPTISTIRGIGYRFDDATLVDVFD